MMCSALFAIFLAASPGLAGDDSDASSRHRLAPRGYELLPHARWLGGLERDGRTLDSGLWNLPRGLPAELRLPTSFRYDSRALLTREPTEDLAGGFRFHRDATTRFLYDAEYEKERRIWSWITPFFPMSIRR